MSHDTIWGIDLKTAGLLPYPSEIILRKCLSTLPTWRLGESQQLVGKGGGARAYVVLCEDVHLVGCLRLQALELVLGDGGILDFHIDVLVLILALNLVTDDNGRDGIAVQDRPRDHG